MKDSLREGLGFQFTCPVDQGLTVPSLLPRSIEFQQMPRVLATGFLVGLMEWACVRAVNPHLDWPAEQTVGVHVDLSHRAATPPGMTLTISGVLERVEGRRLTFALQAHDGLDEVSRGTHQRYVIDRRRFDAQVSLKLEGEGAAGKQEGRG